MPRPCIRKNTSYNKKPLVSLRPALVCCCPWYNTPHQPIGWPCNALNQCHEHAQTLTLIDLAYEFPVRRTLLSYRGNTWIRYTKHKTRIHLLHTPSAHAHANTRTHYGRKKYLGQTVLPPRFWRIGLRTSSIFPTHLHYRLAVVSSMFSTTNIKTFANHQLIQNMQYY